MQGNPETWSKAPESIYVQRRKLSSGLPGGMDLHQHQSLCGQGKGRKQKSSGIAEPSFLGLVARRLWGKGSPALLAVKIPTGSHPGRGEPSLPCWRVPQLGCRPAAPCPSISRGDCRCCQLSCGSAGWPQCCTAGHGAWVERVTHFPCSLCPARECFPAFLV